MKQEGKTVIYTPWQAPQYAPQYAPQPLHVSEMTKDEIWSRVKREIDLERRSRGKVTGLLAYKLRHHISIFA